MLLQKTLFFYLIVILAIYQPNSDKNVLIYYSFYI